MWFSMLYSGKQILSFKPCFLFYAGDSLIRALEVKMHFGSKKEDHQFEDAIFLNAKQWPSGEIFLSKPNSLERFL